VSFLQQSGDRSMKLRTLWPRLLLACVALLATACRPRSPDEVVAYVALDREFSEPVLQDFTSEIVIRKTLAVYQSLLSK